MEICGEVFAKYCVFCKDHEMLLRLNEQTYSGELKARLSKLVHRLATKMSERSSSTIEADLQDYIDSKFTRVDPDTEEEVVIEHQGKLSDSEIWKLGFS